MSVILYKGNTSPSVTDTITVAGAAVDLTGATVRFRARDPRTSALVIDVAATITNPTGGAVRYDPSSTDTAAAYVSPPLTGWWNVTLQSGKVQDAPEFPVYILDHAQATTSDLCTLTDIRTHLNIQPSDTSKDQLISQLIVEASQAVMREVDREFAPVTTNLTRRFHIDPTSNTANFGYFDLQTANTVTLHPEAAAIVLNIAQDQYELNPVLSTFGTYKSITISPLMNLWSIHRQFYGWALLDINGTWGFASIPPDAKLATIRTVEAWMDRAIQAYGSQDSLLGDPLSTLPGGVDSAYGIPAGARRLLKKFRPLMLA